MINILCGVLLIKLAVLMAHIRFNIIDTKLSYILINI
jgi:hypothetical protein